MHHGSMPTTISSMDITDSEELRVVKESDIAEEMPQRIDKRVGTFESTYRVAHDVTECARQVPAVLPCV